MGLFELEMDQSKYVKCKILFVNTNLFSVSALTVLLVTLSCLFNCTIKWLKVTRAKKKTGNGHLEFD